MKDKIYLGDSVYAQNVNGMIRLTTENGFGPSNEIFLEPEVLQRLIMFSGFSYKEQEKIHQSNEDESLI